MDYLFVFVGGALVGALMALGPRSTRAKLEAIRQLQKELLLPEDSPAEKAGKEYLAKAGITNPYAQGVAERAEYKKAKTMWGPAGEAPGEPLK